MECMSRPMTVTRRHPMDGRPSPQRSAEDLASAKPPVGCPPGAPSPVLNVRLPSPWWLRAMARAIAWRDQPASRPTAGGSRGGPAHAWWGHRPLRTLEGASVKRGAWPRTPSAQALGVPAMSAGGRRGVLGSSMSLRRSAGQRRGKAGARVSMRHGLGWAILIMRGEPACRALIPSGVVASRWASAWVGGGSRIPATPVVGLACNLLILGIRPFT
jgi:hypothetical protein